MGIFRCFISSLRLDMYYRGLILLLCHREGNCAMKFPFVFRAHLTASENARCRLNRQLRVITSELNDATAEIARLQQIVDALNAAADARADAEDARDAAVALAGNVVRLPNRRAAA